MIPKEKNDEEAIKRLMSASDDQVIENADQLLEWLQDINWPVFKGIVKRLSVLGNELVVPISNIMESDDSIWKANIVGHLIPSFSKESQKLYTTSLKKLLAEYDENDLREGVIDYVEIQLSNTKNT